MATVAPQQHQPMPARNSPASMDYSRDASASETSLNNAPPPPPAPAAAPAPANSKKKGKKGANDATDAHSQLLQKIHQLEADTQTSTLEQQEIEAEVKKANRDLTNLLNTMDSSNNRMDAVQKKYSDLLGEMKRVEREHQKAKKRGDQLQKDKDAANGDVRRERGLKEKLEKLSRELTRENKKLKEDLRDLKETSADRNEELHHKLENMVLEVEEVVSDRRPSQSSIGEMEQDKLFREKFKSFLEQYELREIQFQSLLRTKDLEIQYQIARHEALKKAQESELSKSHQLTRQVSTFSQTENELRSQLNIYVEKFKQVEDTLNNSNDLFLTFRKEMEEMSKKTKRLEKENLNLTRKQEATNKNIFQMAEERSQSQQTIDRLTKENEKLKKLCRAMQTNGYGAAGAEGQVVPEEEGETDSEYDEYDEDEEGEYDEDTEEEAIEVRPRTYGPVPPPPSLPQEAGALPNGKAKAPVVNGVNGVKH